MANAGGKEEGGLQKPTSSETTTLKKILNICFYVVSLTWIIYTTVLFTVHGAALWRYDAWPWFIYFCLHSTLVGCITYKALMIDLKFKESYFFKNNHLNPIFISFAVTAPLVNLPFVIMGIPNWEGRSEFDTAREIMSTLIISGQLYWLLLPVQVAITVWGKKNLFLWFGYIVFIASILNYYTYFIVIMALAYTLYSLHLF